MPNLADCHESRGHLILKLDVNEHYFPFRLIYSLFNIDNPTVINRMLLLVYSSIFTTEERSSLSVEYIIGHFILTNRLIRSLRCTSTHEGNSGPESRTFLPLTFTNQSYSFLFKPSYMHLDSENLSSTLNAQTVLIFSLILCESVFCQIPCDLILTLKIRHVYLNSSSPTFSECHMASFAPIRSFSDQT